MSRISIRELLSRSSSEVILMDGGTGSTMEDRGVDVRTDLWSSLALLTLDGRDATRRLHADYIDAGADIVIANTHNVSPETCCSFLDGEELGSLDIPPAYAARGEPGPSEEFLEWIEKLGVSIAVEALPAERDVVVAAGIGSQEPWARSTSRTQADIERSLEPCARALTTAEPTFVLFESVSTEPEVLAVANVARRLALRDFGVALTCAPDGHTWGGVSMVEVVRAFEGLSVAAFFVQCTRYDLVSAALQPLVEVASSVDAVVGAYANDGRVWKDRRWQGERVSPRDYADEADRWREAGARIIGGCCGTTPEHIAELYRRQRG
jgi:homocysteine S-methyltransferase